MSKLGHLLIGLYTYVVIAFVFGMFAALEIEGSMASVGIGILWPAFIVKWIIQGIVAAIPYLF